MFNLWIVMSDLFPPGKPSQDTPHPPGPLDIVLHTSPAGHALAGAETKCLIEMETWPVGTQFKLVLSPKNPNLKNVVEPPEPNSRTERFLWRREHMRETPPWSITLKYF